MANLSTILAKMVVLANMLSATEVINKTHTDMIIEADSLKEKGYFLNKDSEGIRIAVEERRQDIDKKPYLGTFLIISIFLLIGQCNQTQSKRSKLLKLDEIQSVWSFVQKWTVQVDDRGVF